PERKMMRIFKMTKDIDGIKILEKNILLKKRPGKFFFFFYPRERWSRNKELGLMYSSQALDSLGS
ncbi:hypothetical protein ACQP3J_32820, partial [Escherichia coli]